jgi:hypothetical protein
MMIWDFGKNRFVEMPAEMEAFLREIAEVSKKHGLSIGHEDRHGAFEIDPYDEDNVDWLMHAYKHYENPVEVV